MMKRKIFVNGLGKRVEYLPLLALAVGIAALAVSSFCTRTPDNCGDGQRLDPRSQFCYEGAALDKCGGRKYDPINQFCHDGAALDKCGQRAYDPARQECSGTSIVDIVRNPTCNGTEYIDAVSFCYNNNVYAKCGGSVYNPSRQECSGTRVVDIAGNPKCNGIEYDDAASFCYNSGIYAKCGGSVYNPSRQECSGTRVVDIVNIVDPVKFSVYFNANGGMDGADPPATVKADSGSSVRIPGQQTLSREGYSFGGWNTTANGTGINYAAGSSYTVNGNVTLYAKWTAVNNTYSYTLTTSVNLSSGGTVSRSPNQTSYTSGTNVTVTATPSSGYTFIGWSGAVSGTANPVTITMDGNKSLTANFQQAQVATSYTLTTSVNLSSGGTVSRSPNQTSYTSGTSVTVTATPASGYTFIGWSGATSSTANPVTIIMDGNKSLTANFQQAQVTPTYTLATNVSPSSGGTVSRSPNQSSYTSGTSVTLTATPSSGYRFVSWSGTEVSSGAANPLTVIMNGNKSITANFLPVQDTTTMYTLTTIINPPDGGKVGINPSQTSYTLGTSVAVTAVAAGGYRFTGWSGAASGTTNPITITMNGNKSLTVNFQEILYTLTIHVNPSGGGTVSRTPDRTSYTLGTSVQVRATPNSGYTFTGWSGGGLSATANPMMITMSGDRELVANFQQQPGGGGSYDYVMIGGVKWMKKNLNIVTADSWCYNNSADSCAKYGRLYSWDAAMSACQSVGWRLPTREDWGNLVIAVGGSDNYQSVEYGGGEALKSTTGWVVGNGYDTYGFTALPGGAGGPNGIFDYVGRMGYWWTSTLSSNGNPYFRNMKNSYIVYEYDDDVGGAGFSVRCVGD